MRKLVLETTAPFQGLPELVACDEGLFAQEGLALEWADREADVEKTTEIVEKTTEINVISPKRLDPLPSRGKLLEQGEVHMYMLEGTSSPLHLVSMDVQTHAHAAAE